MEMGKQLPFCGGEVERRIKGRALWRTVEKSGSAIRDMVGNLGDRWGKKFKWLGWQRGETGGAVGGEG